MAGTNSNSPASSHLGLVTHAVVMTHLHEKRQSAVSDRRRRCLLLRTSGRWLHHLVHALAHLIHLLLHVLVHHHALSRHARHLAHAFSHLLLLGRAHVALGHAARHLRHLAGHVVHGAGHLLRARPAHLAAIFLPCAGVHSFAAVHHAAFLPVHHAAFLP